VAPPGVSLCSVWFGRFQSTPRASARAKSMASVLESDVCSTTIHSSDFITGEVVTCALIVTLAAIAVLYVRRQWNTWFRRLVLTAFADIDHDQNGTIEGKELWAGVLMLYIKLRQANIPADPPPREVVDKLMVKFDFNQDGELSVEEFAEIVGVLSAQTLGRAFAVVLFVTVWPALMGMCCNSVSDQLKAQGPPSWMPAGLVCLSSLLDDMHLYTTLLIVLGWVLVVPKLTALADWCTARMQSKKVAPEPDPTPLLASS
jgi:hypothetical protein